MHQLALDLQGLGCMVDGARVVHAEVIHKLLRLESADLDVDRLRVELRGFYEGQEEGRNALPKTLQGPRAPAPKTFRK